MQFFHYLNLRHYDRTIQIKHWTCYIFKQLVLFDFSHSKIIWLMLCCYTKCANIPFPWSLTVRCIHIHLSGIKTRFVGLTYRNITENVSLVDERERFSQFLITWSEKGRRRHCLLDKQILVKFHSKCWYTIDNLNYDKFSPNL